MAQMILYEVLAAKNNFLNKENELLLIDYLVMEIKTVNIHQAPCKLEYI